LPTGLNLKKYATQEGADMKLGYIGLGKMGKNMVLRLLDKDHEVVAWNRSPEPREEVAKAGATAVETVEALVAQLEAPRTVWLMLPAGKVTNEMIENLAQLLEPGDTVIDGANSRFTDTVANGQLLTSKQIQFLDAGVSGGPKGARNGACIMVGGDKTEFEKHHQLFADISAPDAVRFFPGTGAGHFVKMVHNGIEYGMMQSLAEGFGVLAASEYNLDLKQVTEIYNNQSVIESRLVGWLDNAFAQFGSELQGVSGKVSQNGEGRWTADTAQKMGVPVPALEAALDFRCTSLEEPVYFTGQILTAVRNQFGGHDLHSDNAEPC